MFPPRPELEITLEEIADAVSDEDDQIVNCLTSQIQIQLQNDPKVLIRENGTVREELPAAGAIDSFGSLVKVPTAFLERLDVDLQEMLLNELLRRNPGAIDIRRGEHSIHDVFPANRKRIDTRNVVEVAERIVGKDAKIVNWWKERGEFRLDVVVPNTQRRGAYGLPEVGDYCLGGLRFIQDLKHNLAPTVQEFWYRLACTNGYEYLDEGQKVDLRSHDEDEFLVEFEALAALKMASVVEKIQSFYALKDQPVPNLEQAILRHANEQGLSDRVAFNLVRLAPNYVTEGEPPTMFDVVNIFSNVALAPNVAAGTRRTLEQISGSIAGEHVQRCNICSSKLVGR